jgi:chromosome segregation protein
MRLQRLELIGFKSFPDRSDVAFDSGVTAIVGPNGCGKSNLVDAITWVLGEQSARSLRGERMEDVIFGGSDARKATAAAEVRLLLKGVVTPPTGQRAHGHANGNGNGHGRGNGNGHGLGPNVDLQPLDEAVLEAAVAPLAREVELGRRLYRSGESEYLIDGEVCRLRDVQDLLMDVGMGVKGYAVIEQGKIGQILSAKPAERRQLIEEAAGVTKYRARRRAAELKLEAAQQNLTRVDDLVFELDRQRAGLKRQAAKARRYRRLREELRRWEKVLFAEKYASLRETIRGARERLADARERETVAAAGLGEGEATLGRVRIELAEAEARATALRTEAHARELDNERLQQQIAFDTRQADSLTEGAQAVAEELLALEARRGPVQEEILVRRAASAAADAERARAADVLTNEEEAVAALERRIGSLEQEVEAARATLYANVHSATALHHAIERAEENRARLASDLERLAIEAADLKIERTRLTAERERAQTALRTAQAALEQALAARATAGSEFGQARQLRDQQARSLRALETEMAGASARLESLEQFQATRAGYREAARLVLSSTDAGIARHGSIADHLEVEAGYERAVEAALGDLLQYVIVERHEDAQRGLAFVEERDAGRCGFLVVDAAGADRLEPTSALPRGVRRLATVLQVTGAHSAAIRRAIGDVWVAPTLDDAVRAARQGCDTDVVTHEGTVVRGGFLLAGGAHDSGRDILLNRREIKELADRVTSLRAALETLTAEVTACDERIAAAERNLATLDAERHEHDKGALQAELNATRASEELDRVVRRESQGAAERRGLEEQARELAIRADEARTMIAQLAGAREAAEAALTTSQQRLADQRESLASAGRAAAEAKAAHAALVERASALANDVRRLEDVGAELESRIAGRHDDRGGMDARRIELEQAVIEHRRQLDASLLAFEGLRGDVVRADETVAGLQIDQANLEAQVRQARQSLDAVRGEASQLEVTCATADADLSHLAGNCYETLQATLEEVAEEVARAADAGAPAPADALAAADAAGDEGAEDDEELDTVAERTFAVEGEGREAEPEPAEPAAPITTPQDAITALKAKIARLGPVNMMAIEQFDELEARHQFLTTQRQDLIDAIEQTGEAINRIDRTTRERFHEAFGTINQHFAATFATLFGGGKAGLHLIDEQDELESGIDIIAQPPGKRLQNVQLLSGGEKALTAMALMFALFRYRPSPFCLLDEIDAPLDDANISRFVEMLRGMQDQTQFILVTHHRKTMEIADRLYGVTMEEPGVSKLISLSLN